MTAEVAQTAVTHTTEFLARAIMIANETTQKLAMDTMEQNARPEAGLVMGAPRQNRKE